MKCLNKEAEKAQEEKRKHEEKIRSERTMYAAKSWYVRTQHLKAKDYQWFHNAGKIFMPIDVDSKHLIWRERNNFSWTIKLNGPGVVTAAIEYACTIAHVSHVFNVPADEVRKVIATTNLEKEIEKDGVEALKNDIIAKMAKMPKE